jgi:hypothetical protein
MPSDDQLQFGMIGLGRMGANMVRRLMRSGHPCVVYDRSADAVGVLVQVQRATGNQYPAITHAGHRIFARIVVGERDRRVGGVRACFGADFELTMQHDPLGGQLEVAIIRKAELALDIDAIQSRRADVEHDVHACTDRDDVTRPWNGPAGPGGCSRPVAIADRFLRLGADREKSCGKQ